MNPNTNANMGNTPAAADSTAVPMSAPPSPPLQRGKACLACRRRKIKCDGIRPVCTSCLRGERAEDCEYTDGSRRPRTLVLEEGIARLRARVQELENPEGTSPPVGLYDPYAGANATTGASSSASVIHARVQAPSPISLHHPIERRQAPSPGYPSAEPNRVDLETDMHFHARRALSVIMPHATEVGFFLSSDRLRLRGAHVLPALQSVLTLWSVHITCTTEPDGRTNEHTVALKSTLLLQTQTQLASALNTVDSELDPAILLHVIQTGVLLAYFMQRTGQAAGARYYASGTWALVMMLRLYRRPRLSTGASEEGQVPQASRMREGSTPGNTDLDPSAHLFAFAGCVARLAPALDEIEAEERVRAFWAVYTLDRWFSAVCKTPCLSLAMDGSAENGMTVQWPGVGGTDEVSGATSDVIQHFLNDPNHNFAPDGASAMHAKASVLLGEATGLAASFLANHAISQSPAFRTRFATLDTLLQRCSSAAMAATSVSRGGRQSPQTQTQEQAQAFVTVHLVALARVALHRPWTSRYEPSQQRCVEAALSVVRVLDQLGDVGAQVGGVSPMYAIVWTALCLVLQDEVLRLRAQRDADASRRREEAEVMTAIQTLVHLLSALSQHCPSQSKIEAVLRALESIAG